MAHCELEEFISIVVVGLLVVLKKLEQLLVVGVVFGGCTGGRVVLEVSLELLVDHESNGFVEGRGVFFEFGSVVLFGGTVKTDLEGSVGLGGGSRGLVN